MIEMIIMRLDIADGCADRRRLIDDDSDIDRFGNGGRHRGRTSHGIDRLMMLAPGCLKMITITAGLPST
jgi:hypothetical protein